MIMKFTGLPRNMTYAMSSNLFKHVPCHHHLRKRNVREYNKYVMVFTVHLGKMHGTPVHHLWQEVAAAAAAAVMVVVIRTTVQQGEVINPPEEETRETKRTTVEKERETTERKIHPESNQEKVRVLVIFTHNECVTSKVVAGKGGEV